MQIAINILEETPAALRLAAQFLLTHAEMREAMEAGGQPVPFQTPAPPVPVAVNPAASTSHNPMAPIAPPPPPPLPTMSAPSATTTAMTPPPPMAVAPVPPAALAAPPAPSAPGAADVFDSSGVPFDARIHQKTKGVKKDGTWKLQKGIAETLVASVMAELSTRIRTPSAGASAPVSLPATPSAPPPPPPNGTQAVAPPPPGAEAQKVPDPFRDLVAKITSARKEGKITPEEVTQCVTQTGVPSLQTLNAMPHLVSAVEANIDAILVTR